MDGYAAIVISGSYEECGVGGRYRASAGDVLLHRTFDAHLNWIGRAGAEILNLSLEKEATQHCGTGRFDDIDLLARLAEYDPRAAVALLLSRFEKTPNRADDWPDILASDLAADPAVRLDVWARRHGLTPETVSRGFRKIFDVTPTKFRSELRTLRALDAITRTRESFATISMDSGFADQAHMTRAVRSHTGETPSAWRRRSNSFKTVPEDVV